MARARVTLRGCITYQTPAGKTWKRNESRIVTNASEIAYFRNNTEFNVTDLPDAEPKPPPKSEDPKAYTASVLGRMAKPELVTLAANRFTLPLEDDMRKDDMVTAILEAQVEAEAA